MRWLWWIEIFLWYNCNQKCIFCFQKDLRKEKTKFLDYNYVIKLIDNWMKKWKKSIIFSGWESTLDKNVLEYIKYSKNNGYSDIRVHTNWLNFSKKEVLKKFILNWMTWVVISVHWYWEIHDNLVGVKWAFKKIIKTFTNLYEIKKQNGNFVIDTNTVLTRHNYKNIKKILKFLSYFPITRAQLVQIYSLYLFSDNEKKDLYISYEKFENELKKIVEIKNFNFTLENFPLCKINKKYWDLVIKRQKYNNDAYWNMWEWLDETDCVYIEKCGKCLYIDKCTWIPKDYLSVVK